eukprot:6762962-Pyramimonas_sp.AAC.1
MLPSQGVHRSASKGPHSPMQFYGACSPKSTCQRSRAQVLEPPELMPVTEKPWGGIGIEQEKTTQT